MNSPASVDATPKQLGYRLPAEWEAHEATWLSWPHKEASWPGKIETIFPVYAQMVAALARSETVHINVNDEAMEAKARGFLDDAGASLILVERNPGTSTFPKAHYLNARTMEILRAHNIADEILREGTPLRNRTLMSRHS